MDVSDAEAQAICSIMAPPEGSRDTVQGVACVFTGGRWVPEGTEDAPVDGDDVPRDPDGDLLHTAMTILANVSEGCWDRQTPEWQAAARRWMDEHAARSRATYAAPAEPAP